MSEVVSDRQASIRRGKRLEYLTIGWNGLEGLAALTAGSIAGSISLVGFGMDSIIEVISAVALLWRMSVDADECRRERNERLTLTIVGFCFLGLASYVLYQSVLNLLHRQGPEHSIVGIVLACAAMIVMPMLSRAKKRLGRELKSRAMEADARQADFCAYLSFILLLGLVLNAVLRWWWSDAVAALIMVPIIAKEGLDGVQGKTCCDRA